MEAMVATDEDGAGIYFVCNLRLSTNANGIVCTF